MEARREKPPPLVERERYRDFKLGLSEALRVQRARAGISQQELAERLGSSQSRVSKMEAADPSVSLDLLVRALLAAGATRSDVARALASGPAPPAEIREIVRSLRRGLEEIYGDRLRGVYLYGSYARGEANEGSDLDVLVVLDEVRSSWDEIKRTGGLASEVSLAHGVSVSRIFVPESEWRESDLPFLRNVRREAILA